MNINAEAKTFQTFPATKLKSHAGLLLDTARNSPVLITNHGRRSVYLVSANLFERLMLLEDADLIVRAQAAIDGGMLSGAQTLAFLKGISNANAAGVKSRKKVPRKSSTQSRKKNKRPNSVASG